MKDLVEIAAEFQALLVNKGWKFSFIGGLAIQHWSEPRLTRDVDVTLLTGFGGEEAYVDELLSHYRPRIADAKEFALRNRVLLIQTGDGVGIDVALGALPFEASVVDRSQMVEFAPGIPLRICSAEDLIVMKAFADRPQDRIDLESIFIRQGVSTFDWSYIHQYLQPLCELKEELDILARLEALRRKVAATEVSD